MKMMIRRGTAVFLAVLLMAMTLFGTAATATDTTDRGLKLYRGTFHYIDQEDTFYYGDSYFAASGCDKNEHLRTMSAALAFSVLGTRPQDTVDLMTNIGMEPDSVVMDDMVWGTSDTIGSIIAKKELDDMPLIAVAIRGSDYAGEWANNMYVGTEDDADGFEASAAKVSERIKAYLAANNITQAKLWVVGYSRAGGVANLVGRAINEDPDAFCTSEDDIFVYTYEAPRCSADAAVYKNIHNVFDINELVPHVCPEAWDMHLNGVEEKIGDPDETVMAKCFNLAAENYMKDIGERSKSEFLDQFDDFVGNAIDRDTYATAYQPYICRLCEICLSKNREERQVLVDYLTKVGELIQNYPQLGVVVFSVLGDPDSELNINLVSNLLSGWLDEAKEEVNPPFTDEEYAEVQEAVRPLVTFMLTLADADRYYQETNDKGRIVKYPFYHLITLFANIEDFIMPHYSPNVFKQLKDLDSYYTAGVRIKPGDVYIGQNRYTFDDNGWPLEDIVKAAGFTAEDIKTWCNGYDLRLENVLTKIDEPSMELYLAAAGKFDKSMSMYEFYELSMTKTVGFHSYPVDPEETPVKLKDNPICLTIPQETAKKCVRYGVVRVDDFGVNHQYRLDTDVVKLDNGDVELWVNAMRPAVYASAIDDRRWCTTADVDYDDTVTVLDVTHIQRNLAYLEDFNITQKCASDVDGDSETTILDVTYIQRYLANLSVPYSLGETKAIPESTET